jgi:hypothetical protein
MRSALRILDPTTDASHFRPNHTAIHYASLMTIVKGLSNLGKGSNSHMQSRSNKLVFRLVGILMSVVIAIISDNFVSDRVYSWLIFLVSLSLALHLDSISLIESANKKQESTDSLLNITSQFKWAEHDLRAISDSLLEVHSRPSLEAFQKIARVELGKARSVLGGLRFGQYLTPVTDMLIHFERFDASEKTIFLTNVDHTHLDWWYSEEGRKYWQTNLNALDRGVHIERVFIYGTLTPPLENLIREQALAIQNGRRVYVYAVQKDVLPDELRADIAIWDESFTYQVELNSDGRPISNRYSVNDADVASRMSMYKRIRSQAQLVDSSTGKLDR